ncbi:unnamed protein product [[Actinomadura] parvosata subsp. kistnae]|uniref:SH3b domain-containing protein n=1 Tax=[Actinomadura] parvosata subsp. kistnae TaxID=1909395 RepID=A0A1V0AF97_9ACTN|nr:hypothetical protein [Nonomuraea sp. ATCC 55076]AQZ68890.1 hypothetical protein BKM31_52100 [Nonomuraea sp. ATCC 55076]SPL92572.1 unnamed protein product [Actinomadura parvosata subsp. kistnae]
MLTTRIAAFLVAVSLAAAGLVATAASAEARPGCTYRVVRVKTRLNIRMEPRGRIVDKLYPGDRTWGSCKKHGKWRRVHGTEIGRRGFAFGRYLKKIGRR